MNDQMNDSEEESSMSEKTNIDVSDQVFNCFKYLIRHINMKKE